MKIACPECGQHYEVDSNMLDRHYRCKECKAFFLGLNAKPVKSIQFKKSDEDKTVAAAEEKQTAPTENSAAAGEEVKKDANENPTISGTVVMEPEEDKNADDYKPLKPLKFENIALIAAVVLSVIALLLVIGGNIRISMLSKEIPAAGKSVDAVLDRVNRLDQGALTLVGELGRVKEQLDAAGRSVESAKSADTKLKTQLDEAIERIDLLEQKSILLIRQTAQIAEALEKIEKAQAEQQDSAADSGESSEDKGRRRVRTRR